VLSRALRAASAAAVAGERDASALADLVRGLVATEPTVTLEYVEVRSAAELTPVEHLVDEVLVAVAAKVGETRLIDNVTLTVRGTEVHADLGVTPELRREGIR
jgi:pantothenate synthetase